MLLLKNKHKEGHWIQELLKSHHSPHLTFLISDHLPSLFQSIGWDISSAYSRRRQHHLTSSRFCSPATYPSIPPYHSHLTFLIRDNLSSLFPTIGWDFFHLSPPTTTSSNITTAPAQLSHIPPFLPPSSRAFPSSPRTIESQISPQKPQTCLVSLRESPGFGDRFPMFLARIVLTRVSAPWCAFLPFLFYLFPSSFYLNPFVLLIVGSSFLSPPYSDLRNSTNFP